MSKRPFVSSAVSSLPVDVTALHGDAAGVVVAAVSLDVVEMDPDSALVSPPPDEELTAESVPSFC